MPAEDPTPRPPKRHSSKGKVHDVFKKRLDELVKKGLNFAKGFMREEQRQWNVPEDLEASSLFEIPNLHKPSFERSEINVNYSKCFQDSNDMGTVGDVVSLKFQMDYNAAEERQFRFRHSSTCRCLTHAMARRRAHGEGPTFAYIERQASDEIKAGAIV